MSSRERSEYWLSKRTGSQNYCRTWFDGNVRQTKRASLGTKNRREAELRLAKWRIENESYKAAAPDCALLEVILLQYFEQHARQTRSADAARHALRYWCDFFAGATVSDLTFVRLEAFGNHLLCRGCSPGYAKKILSTGRAALNRAKKRGEIASVPFIPMIDCSAPRRAKILDQEAMARLLNAAVEKNHLWNFIVISLNTLGRPEAVLELARPQLDFHDRLIRLNPEGRNQTKKIRGTVAMTDTARFTLRDVKFNVVEWHGRPVKSIKKAFAAAVRKAALGPGIMPYSLRRTMSTELRNRGVGVDEIAGMMGHRSRDYSTTELYAEYRPSYTDAAPAAIDNYFEEIQRLVRRPLRASCVLVDENRYA